MRTQDHSGRRRPPPLQQAANDARASRSGRGGWLLVVFAGVATGLFLGLFAGFTAWRGSPDSVREDIQSPTDGISGLDATLSNDRLPSQRLAEIDAARRRLAAGVDGRTPEGIRRAAEELALGLDRLRPPRRDEATLPAGGGDETNDDPEAVLAAVLGTCDTIERLLRKPAPALTTQELAAANNDLVAADRALRRLQEQMADLAQAERAEQQRQSEMAKTQELEAHRQRAFEAFLQLETNVELPPVADTPDLGGGPPGREHLIDLGPFAVEDLIHPGFRLAMPRDTIDQKPFVVTIEAAEPADGRERAWLIQYQPQDAAFDGATQKPRTLATLSTRDNRLLLEVPRSQGLADRPFSLFRRSVILAEAMDPAGGPAALKEIRLVKPRRIGPLEIDPLGEMQSFPFSPPAGIASVDVPWRGEERVRYEWPVASIEIKADLAGKKKVAVQLPEDAQAETAPGIGSWQVTLMPLHQDPGVLSLGMQVQMSLREGVIAVQPQFVGLRAKQVTREMVVRNFLDEPEKALNKVLSAFDRRVEQCPGHDFGKARNPKGAEIIRAWFLRPLATEQSMGMTLPGHELVWTSFDGYLKKRYAEEDKKLQARRDQGEQNVPERPSVAANFQEWQKECESAKTDPEWKRVFTTPLENWERRFREDFAGQWQEYVRVFQGGLTEFPQITMQEITSLAYDDAGNVYRVPLLVFDATMPAATGCGEVGVTPAPSALPPRDTVPSPSGGGIKAGLD